MTQQGPLSGICPRETGTCALGDVIQGCLLQDYFRDRKRVKPEVTCFSVGQQTSKLWFIYTVANKQPWFKGSKV